MRARLAAVLFVCAFVVLSPGFALLAGAADVSGTLEINKKKFKLVHGYVDMAQPENPLIVLSDKPLPAEQLPFLNADYTLKKKVHAVVFGVDRKDRKIGDMRWVYFGGDSDIPVTVFAADKVSLDLMKADDNIIEGKIRTPKPDTRGDLTFSFDASFKLSTKAALAKATAPKKVTFTGDDSAPVKAYKEYYRAIMAGNYDSIKKYMTAKNLKEFEAMDRTERGVLLDLMKMRPEKLNIEKPSMAGNEAAFKAHGKEGSAESTGSIKMLNEGGSWKVLEDKWKTVSK